MCCQYTCHKPRGFLGGGYRDGIWSQELLKIANSRTKYLDVQNHLLKKIYQAMGYMSNVIFMCLSKHIFFFFSNLWYLYNLYTVLYYSTFFLSDLWLLSMISPIEFNDLLLLLNITNCFIKIWIKNQHWTKVSMPWKISWSIILFFP